MLSNVIPPHRTGIYMGIFNLFIVIPEILFAVVVSSLISETSDIRRVHVVMFGGLCLLIAALATLFVSTRTPAVAPSQSD
jgi:maltose/moltooligosaccharide transporter